MPTVTASLIRSFLDANQISPDVIVYTYEELVGDSDLELAKVISYSGSVKTVNVHEAKTNLSELLKRVEAGDEVLIARAGKPVARLVPASGDRKRMFGFDTSDWNLPEDFNDPLPEETLKAFHKRRL